MATALEWYDMEEYDVEDQIVLPTARFHYDMEEYDEAVSTPAWGYDDAGLLASSYTFANSWLEVEDAPEFVVEDIQDGSMLYLAGVDLAFLAQCLVAFFSTSSRFMKTAHMKIWGVFSAGCIVKVKVCRGGADQMYVIQFHDLGTSNVTFREVVCRAVHYLQTWGICLWEPSL